MNKIDLLRYFYNHENHDLVFLANVIEGCRNPAKKLKGMYLLLQQGHIVSLVSFETYAFKLDGITNYPLSEFELVVDRARANSVK